MNSFIKLGALAVEEVKELSTGGWAAENAWIMLVLPFVSALAILALGKRKKLWGSRIAIGMMSYVFLHGGWLWYLSITQGVVYEKAVSIGDVGQNFHLEWGWVVDGLSSMMYFVVGTVALLVFIYASSYMKGEKRYAGFFASLSLFAGAMLVLVASPNIVQLIVGWELVGVASYLLIGHYWENKENSSAGMKAFLVNKVADVGLIIGAIMVAVGAGSFRITEILHAAEEGTAGMTKVAVAGAGLLFIGAMGKSAQFPLHVWLPDAMAGPTPVSALMHAATMVTAGVYLLARFFPLYEGLGEPVRVYIMWIGAITLLLTGLLALVQTDLKKVLAYSTLSQLGYMVTAMGAGAYTAGIFHLFTHAFFKALLFLAAGSVIHAVHSNEMIGMGGIRKFMPTTYKTFLIGSIALAGLPPLAGFFSKDEILVGIDIANVTGNQFVLWTAIAGAFITPLYMTRAIALTFFGSYKGHGEPHEAPKTMTIPLVVLAALSVVAGWVNIPGVYTGFATWTAQRAEEMDLHHAESFDYALLTAGVVAALLGVVVGWRLWGKDAETQEARDTFEIPVLYPLLRNKYYLDDFYLWLVGLIKGPLARFVDWVNSYVIDTIVNAIGAMMVGLGGIVYTVLDQKGIDLFMNGLAGLAGGSGGKLRLLQTGRVQQYAGAFVLGAVVLVIAFVAIG